MSVRGAVSSHRPGGDAPRYALAARMLEEEVRTETICRWTTLPARRVRELSRAYAREHGHRGAVRHRGPAATQPNYFLRSWPVRTEAGALAAVCAALGAIPEQRMPNARQELPSVALGELICDAYEMFRQLVDKPLLTLENALVLVTTLAQGQQLRLGHCPYCGGAVIFGSDESNENRTCRHCQEDGPNPRSSLRKTGRLPRSDLTS